MFIILGGLLQAGCSDAGPSENSTSLPDGLLMIVTSTAGGNPDTDGYLLQVDDLEPIPLSPSDTSELRLGPGPHSVQLSGVAPQCTVSPGTTLEVEVQPAGTLHAGFEILCPGALVRITTNTTGLDLDTDYRVVVDQADQGGLAANSTRLTQVAPGRRTIALAGLKQTCKVTGSDSLVEVADGAVVPVEFAVVCTATSGVVAVFLHVTGLDELRDFRVWFDGTGNFDVERGGPSYVSGVASGDHMLYLVGPTNCAVSDKGQKVSVGGGALIRDTVRVDFSSTCVQPSKAVGAVRITAPTRGPILPSTRFTVSYESYGYWDYGGEINLLGQLQPNDTLLVDLPASGPVHYWYHFYLSDLPRNCRTLDSHPYANSGVTITHQDTLDIRFEVLCS
jgi:hypothetical protein